MLEITDLPNLFPLVKNYWFFYGNDGPAQFVFTFGTTKLPLNVNNRSAKYPKWTVLLWGYHPKTGKRLVIDDSFEMDFLPKKPVALDFQDDEWVMEHEEIKIKFSKEFLPKEHYTIFRKTEGVNEYRNFKGKMFGKKIRGKGYCQRANVGTPLASWDWLRFSNGDVGGLFKTFGRKSVLNLNGKEYVVDLSAKSGVLEIQSDLVDLKTEPYEKHNLYFSGLGRLRYTEFFVNIKGKVDGKKINSYGIVEEARGIVF
ncbi:MAG: hypothetical protein GOU99_03735 [Candidatus Altiarchaeota archaeon]|nr:hypothetical protein [Candidatus Altiarchaeota archaeon]